MTHKFATPVFVLGLLLVGTAAGYPQSSEEAKEAELKGEAAMTSKDWDAAIANFSEAIDIDPNYALAYSNRGLTYSMKYDYDIAIADLTEAIRLDPNSTCARIRRGDAFASKHQVEKSIADYSEAIRIDPKCTRAYTNRADVYVEIRKFEKALADCTEAIRIDPKETWGYVERAHVYAMQGDWDKLMKDARAAMRVDPKSAKVNNTLGIAFDGYAKTMMGTDEKTAGSLFDRASAYFEAPPRKLDEAQEQLPFDGSIEHFRAAAKKLDRAHKAQLLFDYSAEFFKTAIEIQPDYDFGNNNLGVYYARRNKPGDAARAEKYFRAALEFNPRYADALNNLAIVLAQQGKLDEAIATHKTGLAIRYNRASDHNNLCGVYIRKGDLENALKEDDVALKCDPRFLGAWESRAEIYERQKNLDEAAKCVQIIVAIDAKSRLAQNVEGKFIRKCTELNRAELALAVLSQAINTSPMIPENYAWRAEVYYQQRDWRRAKRDFEEVRHLRPEIRGVQERIDAIQAQLDKPSKGGTQVKGEGNK